MTKDMIKELHIQNFQSHKQTDLTLAPGINAFLGSSDTGKSAILRALRWLIWNRPQGDAFRSTWGGDTSVSLVVSSDDQDFSITRAKSKSDNIYTLNDLEFRAFGTEVPEEITNVLNINGINFQQQLERPFLLDSSPGEVASHFNRVAHLDTIDFAISNIQRWIRETERNISTVQDRKTDLEESLEQYIHLDEVEKDIQVAEALERHLSSLTQRKVNISRILHEIQEAEERKKTYSRWTKLEKPVARLIKLNHDHNELSDILDKLKDVNDDISLFSDVLELEDEVNIILESISRLKVLTRRFDQLESLIRSAVKTDRQYSQTQALLNDYELQFESAMPDQCPLCGQTIPKQS